MLQLSVQCCTVHIAYKNFNFSNHKSCFETVELKEMSTRKSWAWIYFTPGSASTRGSCAVCDICGVEIQRGNSGTSAMITHLTQKHSIFKPEGDGLETKKIKIESRASDEDPLSEDQPMPTSQPRTKLRKRKCPATFSSTSQDKKISKVQLMLIAPPGC